VVVVVTRLGVKEEEEGWWLETKRGKSIEPEGPFDLSSLALSWLRGWPRDAGVGGVVSMTRENKKNKKKKNPYLSCEGKRTSR
jgi:hypothetical protein